MKLNIYSAILILTSIFLPLDVYAGKSVTYFRAEKECEKGNPYGCIVVQTAIDSDLGNPRSHRYIQAQKKCLRGDNNACNYLKAISGKGTIETK